MYRPPPLPSVEIGALALIFTEKRGGGGGLYTGYINRGLHGAFLVRKLRISNKNKFSTVYVFFGLVEDELFFGNFQWNLNFVKVLTFHLFTT